MPPRGCSAAWLQGAGLSSAPPAAGEGAAAVTHRAQHWEGEGELLRAHFAA